VTVAGNRIVLTGEQRTVYSPAWLLPYDEFRRRRVTERVVALLDRRDGTAWRPTGIAPTLTPGGVLAYPGLGRRRQPFPAEPDRYRVRMSGPGASALYLADDGSFAADRVGLEFQAFPYDDTHPPVTLARPLLVRLLPGPTYPYPPGTRVITGLVRRAGGGPPVPNALIECHGSTTPEGVAWSERALAGADGSFRLALRWQGAVPAGATGPETFQLTATESPDRTGVLVIHLPDDLSRVHVVETG